MSSGAVVLIDALLLPLRFSYILNFKESKRAKQKRTKELAHCLPYKCKSKEGKKDMAK